MIELLITGLQDMKMVQNVQKVPFFEKVQLKYDTFF